MLELCSEASAMRMCVMLIWPLLIAGGFCLDETRDKVRSLFDAFQSDYGEDLEAAVSADRSARMGVACSRYVLSLTYSAFSSKSSGGAWTQARAAGHGPT